MSTYTTQGQMVNMLHNQNSLLAITEQYYHFQYSVYSISNNYISSCLHVSKNKQSDVPDTLKSQHGYIQHTKTTFRKIQCWFSFDYKWIKTDRSKYSKALIHAFINYLTIHTPWYTNLLAKENHYYVSNSGQNIDVNDYNKIKISVMGTGKCEWSNKPVVHNDKWSASYYHYDYPVSSMKCTTFLI